MKWIDRSKEGEGEKWNNSSFQLAEKELNREDGKRSKMNRNDQSLEWIELKLSVGWPLISAQQAKRSLSLVCISSRVK